MTPEERAMCLREHVEQTLTRQEVFERGLITVTSAVISIAFSACHVQGCEFTCDTTIEPDSEKGRLFVIRQGPDNTCKAIQDDSPAKSCS